MFRRNYHGTALGNLPTVGGLDISQDAACLNVLRVFPQYFMKQAVRSSVLAPLRQLISFFEQTFGLHLAVCRELFVPRLNQSRSTIGRTEWVLWSWQEPIVAARVAYQEPLVRGRCLLGQTQLHTFFGQRNQLPLVFLVRSNCL